MTHDFENPGAKDRALTRQHDAGRAQDRLSPAERALAPEARAPMQSATAISDDGTYVGQAGGYPGADTVARQEGKGPNPLGEGNYGFPYGPGVGVPGGEHQPEGLPAPYAPGPEDALPAEPDAHAQDLKRNPPRHPLG